MKLISPNIAYGESYADALREFRTEASFPDSIDAELQDIPSSIEHKLDVSKGKNLVSGEIARSEFWLIDDEKYIGKIEIRHQPRGRVPEAASHVYYEVRPSEREKGYGAELLRQGIREARLLGLSELIVTCKKDNLPSQKIIETNGGKFVTEVMIPGEEVFLLKYIISLV